MLIDIQHSIATTFWRSLEIDWSQTRRQIVLLYPSCIVADDSQPENRRHPQIQKMVNLQRYIVV